MGEFRAVGQFEQEVGQFEQVSREAAKQNKAVDYTQRSTEVMDNEPLSSEVMDNEPLTSEVMDNEPLSTDDEEYDTTYNEEYSDEEATTPTPLASPAACSSPIVTAEMPQAILCPYCLVSRRVLVVSFWTLTKNGEILGTGCHGN